MPDNPLSDGPTERRIRRAARDFDLARELARQTDSAEIAIDLVAAMLLVAARLDELIHAFEENIARAGEGI